MKSQVDRSSGDLNTITAILELSYQNLPLELKACFLCLGFFKEDSIIKVKELVHIWVAQGLVAQEVEREEVARDYLNELISRNMVQVKEIKYDEVKACHMHDLLRDLSIRKAKKEIDFEVVREVGNSSHQSLAKPRHRAIYCSETRFIYSTNRNQHLRSLFIHYYMHSWLYISGGPSSYWKIFELLRVLHLGNTIFEVLPNGIGELSGLRYLKIRCSEVLSRLPRSWAKLKNLEVLDLRGNTGVIKIDKVILNMESLRHLYAVVESWEVGLGNMRKLQTLQMFRIKSSSDVWKIQGMNGVSKLGIEVMFEKGETSSSLLTCLSSLENLFHLTISHFLPSRSTAQEGLTYLHRVTRLKLKYGLLPAYFPPNLTHLTLRRIWWKEDTMAVLEKLPNLLYLNLYDFYTYDDGIMVITSGGFPSLQVLHLHNILRSCKMQIEESAMPQLNQFIIPKHPILDVEDVPERIKYTFVQLH